MATIRTNAAAAMLGVSPNTLRSWERRFGFPQPRRTSGGHRQFDVAEIEALRTGLEQTRSISAAISLARERGVGPATPDRLRAAFLRFDEPAADRVVEESLGVRSVERTVEEVILAALEPLAGDEAATELGFAVRWATGWLSAQRRLAPPASRDETIVLFDAADPGGIDALHVQALELLLRRSGLPALALPVGTDPARATRALRALDPAAIVLAGPGAPLDVLGRLVYAARRVCGAGIAVLDYRGALPDTGATTVERLGDRPLLARELVLAHLDSALRARDPESATG